MNRDMQAVLQQCMTANGALPMSECVRLLLDAVQHQAHQISRLEEIVASQVSDPATSAPPTQLVDLQAQVTSLHQQVSDLQDSAAAWRAHQDAQEAQRSTMRQQHLQQERRLSALEQQLGVSAHPTLLLQQQQAGSTGAAAGSSPQGGGDNASSKSTPAAAGLFTDRLRRLELKVATLADNEATQEEQISSTASRLKGVEGLVRAELTGLRGEVQQAVAAACVSSSTSAEALVVQRVHELEKNFAAQLDRLSASVDTRLAATGARVADSVVGDMDNRLAALAEELELQLKGLSGQLEVVSSSKADTAALAQYTSQVTQVFEQLAGNAVSSSQEGMAELQAQLQQMRHEVASLAASKADLEALQQQRDGHSEDVYVLQQDLQQLRRSLGEVAAVARSTPTAVENVRLEVAEVAGRLEALQLTASGLQGSVSAGSRGLDSCNQRQQQVLGRCQVLEQQVRQLALEVLGPSGASTLAAAGSSGAVGARGRAPSGPGRHGSCGGDAADEGAGAGQQEQDGSDVDAGIDTDDTDSAAQRAQDSTGSSSRHHSRRSRRRVGPAAAGAGAGGGANKAKEAGWGLGLPVSARLSRLECNLQELAADLVGKAPAEDVHDLVQQLDTTQSQVASCCDAVRALTSSTYRRVDEHASSIQRLTAAISSSVEDRPNTAAIKVLIADALEGERREAAAALKCASAALRAEQQQQQLALQRLQSAQEEAVQQQQDLKQQQAELQATCEAAASQLAALEQQLGEVQETWQDQITLLQQQVDRDAELEARAIVQELIDRQLPLALSGPSKQLSQLEGRLTTLSEQLEQYSCEVAVQRQQQAEQHQLLVKLEAELTSGTTPAAQALRGEMVAAVEACAAAAGQLMELQQAVVEHKQQLGEVQTKLSEVLPRDKLRHVLLRGAEGVARALLQEYQQQDDVRWQVWLEKFADALEARLTRSEAEQLVAATTKATLLQAGNLARSSASKAAGLATGQAVDAVGSRMAAVEGRLEQLEVLVVRQVTQQSHHTQQQQQQQPIGTATAGAGSTELAAAVEAAAELGRSSPTPAARGVAASPQQWAALLQKVAAKADAAEVQADLAGVQQQLLDAQEALYSKADAGEVQQVLAELKQQLLQALQQTMPREEVEAALSKKLDIASYLAAAAATAVDAR